MFDREDIPDHAAVFRAIHRVHVKEGHIRPSAFGCKAGEGLSVDWEKYSTADESRLRRKVPEDNGIAGLAAGAIREINSLRVDHDPIESNRAHSEIRGELASPETRLKLQGIAAWRITIAGG